PPRQSVRARPGRRGDARALRRRVAHGERPAVGGDPPRAAPGGGGRRAARPAVAAAVTRPHVLRDYAFIADGERGGLVGPEGDVAWLCFPRWDSDAVFSELVGGGGTYAVRPRGRCVWGGYYERGSLIWRSRWVTEDGIVECREALALPAGPGPAGTLARVPVPGGAQRGGDRPTRRRGGGWGGSQGAARAKGGVGRRAARARAAGRGGVG